MARGFGATDGASGSADRVTTVSYALPQIHSVGLWTWRTDATQDTFIFARGTGDWFESSARYDPNSGGQFILTRGYSGTGGEWSFPAPATNGWHHILVTHDSSGVNTPVVYVDGATVTVTGRVTPSGTGVTTTDVRCIGNRTGGDLAWGGRLAEFAEWSVVLTAAEAAALAKGVAPSLVRPASLVEYVPLVRDTVSRKLAAPTATGTAVQPHAPVYLPRAITVGKGASGGAPTTLTPAGLGNTPAFGGSALTSIKALTPAGLGNAPAFGTATLTSAKTLTPGGLGNTPAYGTAALTSLRVLTPSGLGNAPGYGSATLAPGAVALQPGGLGNAPAYGTAALTSGLTLTPSGLGNAPAYGTASLTPGAVALTPSGLGNTPAFGTTTLTSVGGPTTLTPDGLGNTPAFGGATLSSALALAPSGLGNAPAYGTATLTPGVRTLTPGGLGNVPGYGAATLAAVPVGDPISNPQGTWGRDGAGGTWGGGTNGRWGV